jgi:antirestriction protein ArdC
MSLQKGKSFEEKLEQFNKEVDELAGWIIDQMRAGASKWQMPWHKGIPQAMNAYTGRLYSGNNMMILWRRCLVNEYPKNKWATLRQWGKMKAHVKRGQKGTLVCIAIPKIKKEADISTIASADLFGSRGISNKNVRFSFKFLHVFNQSQVNGYYGDQPDLFNPTQLATAQIDQLTKKSNAVINVGGERAYYSIADDYIQMPDLARFIDSPDFPSLEKYNSTLLHELIHWTGNSNRCDRQFGKKFGSPEYAFEELVAELGSAILSTQFNQKVYPRPEHVQYLSSWINVLEHDFSYFTEALELARYATYWLFQETGVYPFDLKDQSAPTTSLERVSTWNDWIGSSGARRIHD